jgi:hypothetical protein
VRSLSDFWTHLQPPILRPASSLSDFKGSGKNDEDSIGRVDKVDGNVKDDKLTAQGELFLSCSDLASKAAIPTRSVKVHSACHCGKSPGCCD